MTKSHIRLATIAGWQCRVWTNSRGETFVLNRIAPAGHCVNP